MHLTHFQLTHAFPPSLAYNLGELTMLRNLYTLKEGLLCHRTQQNTHNTSY